jgi:hypothetical protein
MCEATPQSNALTVGKIHSFEQLARATCMQRYGLLVGRIAASSREANTSIRA